MSVVIFDIDGTLTDAAHRLHYVRHGAKQWDQFFAEAKNDPPHQEIVDLAKLLHASGKTILLVSGRPEKTRADTLQWMADHGVPFSELYMRPDGDHRQDFIVKAQILDGILADGHEIDFVIDDRPSVVAMWRERGLVCLQCRDWEEQPKETSRGMLTLMIGPSGAGKTTWLKGDVAREYGIDASHVVSSDQIRADLCGDFRDQTKNEQVFEALHTIVKARISSGLPAVVDATNLRRKDRLACVGLADGGPVRYIILDRTMEEKRRDGAWRNELPFDLLEKHAQTFSSQIKDILRGDDQPNVKFVLDFRSAK